MEYPAIACFKHVLSAIFDCCRHYWSSVCLARSVGAPDLTVWLGRGLGRLVDHVHAGGQLVVTALQPRLTVLRSLAHLTKRLIFLVPAYSTLLPCTPNTEIVFLVSGLLYTVYSTPLPCTPNTEIGILSLWLTVLRSLAHLAKRLVFLVSGLQYSAPLHT